MICVFESDKISTYLLPISVFKDGKIISWRMNRPADKLRVAEISEYMCKHQPVKIDGEILAAKITSEWNEGRCFYEVYDGNHRREAALMEYVNQNPSAMVLVSVITVEDDQDLMTHFHRINKVVPLSDVHLQTDQRILLCAKEHRGSFALISTGMHSLNHCIRS